MVLSEALAAALGNQRGTTTREMPPPVLVVEVVSPGKTNEERDYRYRRSEYAARGIAEYWIIDPQQCTVTVLTLVAGLYESVSYAGGDRVLSSLFPQFNLTVEQLLQSGMTSKE